jgi:SAM-dependent methyltransferase
MLKEETTWIKNILNNEFSKNDFPLLNLGSSTEEFRKTTQPYIYKNVFSPLTEEKKKVIHSDIKNEKGVDLVGDINKESFREQVKLLSIKSIICSNMLEHLSEPHIICKSILEVLPIGGKLIVTLPLQFPYHKDPIDTMLRPSIDELLKMFPGTKCIESAVVLSSERYIDTLRNNKKYYFIMLTRWLTPFYKYYEWKFMIKDFFNRKKNYSATCVLLQKQ